MTNTFTASNGWYTDENGVLNAGAYGYFADPDEAEAAEQFFIERRDAELGRWRDTVEPNYVVYPVGDDVVDVLRESSVSPVAPGPGRQASVTREDAEGWDRDHSQSFYAAARRYFQAHPQHKPLPTEPGLYVNRRDLATYPSSASVLKRDLRDRWTFHGTPDGAEDIARVWHDAGELVRLAPVESEDDE